MKITASSARSRSASSNTTTDTSERRKHPRIALDAPVFVGMAIGAADEVLCIIKNISLEGMLLELPPVNAPENVAIGQDVAVVSCDEFEEEIFCSIRGVVAWVGGRQCGIRFTSPARISEDTLRAVLFVGESGS